MLGRLQQRQQSCYSSGEVRLKQRNAPLVKTAANTPRPHEAAIACQHFNALPFCHADNSTQRKSTFPSKETQQNILLGYTLPHDQNILTSQRLQLRHLAQAQANSMHELDEHSHENLHFEKELITGISLWTYCAGKQPTKFWIPASQRELAFKYAHCQTHPGKRETKLLCKERYFWKGLPADVFVTMRYPPSFFLMAKLGAGRVDEPSITNPYSRNLSNSFFIAVNASGDCG